MRNRTCRLPLTVACGLLLAATVHADPPHGLQHIRLSEDGQQFVQGDSLEPFRPWGFNYDHEADGRLLEDYWLDDWSIVEDAFREMRQLGANTVRIHLQFGRFMDSPTSPCQRSLQQLQRLLALAERNGLYLDLTGLGCYHKQDVPEWYDQLSESGRWDAQAVFWRAVAGTCRESPAVFCYDLMNEPVVPGGDMPRTDWLGPGFAGKHFVQYISLDRKGRDRTQVARDWIRHLTRAIRQDDPDRLITVGLVPWSLYSPGLTSGFAPEAIAAELDFIAVHLYPEQGKVDEAIDILRQFAEAGKPVVIEETFLLKCGPDDLSEFLDQSRQYACGWIGFYWGKTPEEYDPPQTIAEALTLQWLQLFQRKREQMIGLPDLAADVRVREVSRLDRSCGLKAHNEVVTAPSRSCRARSRPPRADVWHAIRQRAFKCWQTQP